MRGNHHRITFWKIPWINTYENTILTIKKQTSLKNWEPPTLSLKKDWHTTFWSLLKFLIPFTPPPPSLTSNLFPTMVKMVLLLYFFADSSPAARKKNLTNVFCAVLGAFCLLLAFFLRFQWFGLFFYLIGEQLKGQGESVMAGFIRFGRSNIRSACDKKQLCGQSPPS
jgi:hypothetical protein